MSILEKILRKRATRKNTSMIDSYQSFEKVTDDGLKIIIKSHSNLSESHKNSIYSIVEKGIKNNTEQDDICILISLQFGGFCSVGMKRFNDYIEVIL